MKTSMPWQEFIRILGSECGRKLLKENEFRDNAHKERLHFNYLAADDEDDKLC